MAEVTVSPKFQVVIPKEIRESMGIVSGQKVQMIKYKNRIELIPMKSMKEMKGFLKGINTEVHRDDDRI
ncbi:MAG: AbrB/MazE/SpoVT family DNA-binding domain-containing protein [Gammaproteobacteria bacterium]|nr:AbrB/MazE/SpoVT family DNA-binding domain-containing protein [Gammaproteobacteria bacterium]